MNDSRDFFETLAKVLLRCTIFGFVLLFAWFGAWMSGIVYNVHGPMLELSRHELDLIHYCGLATFKIFVVTVFFIPWLSIKLALRGKPARHA